MPPKRKNKPIPPAKKTNLGASARAGTSAVPTKRKQQGEDWKQSRLAPDIPLHMTTRRAAKTSSNHTSPAAPSSAASGSRRSSLSDVAQQSDFDDEPAKHSRMSTESGSPNGSFGNNTPLNGTQTPELDDSVSEVAPQESRAAGKRRRASDDSTQSSRTRPNGVLTRTQNDVSEQQPRRKKRKTASAHADSASQPPDLTDASTAPNSPELVPDVAISQDLQNVLPANGDGPAKVPKRLPGRRRQPHPDMNVEVDLRRQLSLKTSYRSVAKVLKGFLDELAQRTINNLDDDSEFHRNCPEYKPLIDGLDRKRDVQLDYLAAWRSERMDQLERVRIAEEQIQEQQYINRFEDLRDDCLQRCYFRMKQIEREWKAAQDDATDDEDNVLPPTYTDDPVEGADNRLGSKFASRSRAYVEADRELENDVKRKLFDQLRTTHVEKDDDADDSIEDLTGGFARYAGPDRTEATAHYNINSLADAAHDIERTPSPPIRLPKAQVIPNDQATMLMFLADLSTAQPIHNPDAAAQNPRDSYQPPYAGPSMLDHHLARQSSPVPASGSSLAISSQAALDESMIPAQSGFSHTQYTLQSELNGIHAAKTPEVSEKPSEKPTPARTTHRIMDMLNNDSDVPVTKARASLPSVQEPQPPNTPSGRENGVKHETPSRGDAARLGNIVNQLEKNDQTEHHVDQQLMDALSGPVLPATEPPSPARPVPMPWQQSSALPPPSIPPPREADESLRRKDPRETLRRIRELLDRKAEEHGMNNQKDRSHWSAAYLGGDSDHFDRREAAPAYDPQHPSAGLQGASDTHGHLSYRRESYDRTSHWDRDRRQSGSQVSRPSPYQGSPPQPYHGELSRHTPTHQSPYASLPPKPPGPPPANPGNFRFAHYDPVPPPLATRTPYQPPTSNYPPASHPPHPPLPPGPYGHTYPSPYQHAYAPPPGPYQPQPPPLNAAYPPLKIHQYGGQPILPASMAPPPYTGPVQQGQPPAANLAFSPPQGPASTLVQPPLQPNPQSDQIDRRDSSFMGPQSRPRRAYRSYHAPGTQFRTYNGPGGGRGRGGGGG
ncbi:uncharacterized protein M421DRAFT_207423 [Didymella exigua CBS 183.55]|uniref:Uncharacterized protein n=1 Tax=Didymella exigua CBS 183.55 TaxID=1150837 RepID=A0A6A5RGD5_9PLEO|nr:uncharacterized protein M421DRAFT_207423 [Didymella exigua CBS 183.55]KAF1926812.1 hypothetical protein M421DRAFT_207423 [Didymella exigua CBS 183.55]